MQKKMPGVIVQDLSLVLLWSSSPAPAVSQRIPLMLAVLALNASNRERLGNVNGAMKASNLPLHTRGAHCVQPAH